jgi:hypothetical protein
MNVEELRTLARAGHPLSPSIEGLHWCEQVVAYNDLAARFRERVTRALNSLTLDLAVDPELEQELRLLARVLPDVRSRAEDSVQRVRSGPAEETSLARASLR